MLYDKPFISKSVPGEDHWKWGDGNQQNAIPFFYSLSRYGEKLKAPL
jgi:hypothetical protein